MNLENNQISHLRIGPVGLNLWSIDFHPDLFLTKDMENTFIQPSNTYLQIHPNDNAIVALQDLPKGSVIKLNGDTFTFDG